MLIAELRGDGFSPYFSTQGKRDELAQSHYELRHEDVEAELLKLDLAAKAGVDKFSANRGWILLLVDS